VAAKDLITSARALQNIQGYSSTGSLDSLVATLVTAVSEAIEKYCGRRFVSRAFDELYNGTGDRRLLLRQYPLQAVTSVRYRPVTVLKITNTDPTNVQARVAVTSLGLVLTRLKGGGTATEPTQLFTTNPTLTSLAAAVSAVGNSWSAQVVGDATNYGGWPSADLYVPGSYGDALEGSGTLQSQGALSCVAGSFAELKMHTYELQGYQWDARGWLLRAIPYTDPELLHPEDLIFPVGINNFRVQYTAGYTTVPEAVQEACAEWVAELYWQAQRDPQLASTRVSGGASTVFRPPAGWTVRPTDNVARLLAPYRRLSVATNQG
jgi:hypothetical protein